MWLEKNVLTTWFLNSCPLSLNMSELLKLCRNPLISHTCLFSFLFLWEKKMEAVGEFTPQAAFVTYGLAFTNRYIHVLDFYVRPSLCALEAVYSCLLKHVPPYNPSLSPLHIYWIIYFPYWHIYLQILCKYTFSLRPKCSRCSPGPDLHAGAGAIIAYLLDPTHPLPVSLLQASLV